jgi:hypothetical protein
VACDWAGSVTPVSQSIKLGHSNNTGQFVYSVLFCLLKALAVPRELQGVSHWFNWLILLPAILSELTATASFISLITCAKSGLCGRTMLALYEFCVSSV